MTAQLLKTTWSTNIFQNLTDLRSFINLKKKLVLINYIFYIFF